MRRLLSSAALAVILAGCIPDTAPPPGSAPRPAHRPRPRATPTPAPLPSPAPAPAPALTGDWNDWPVTPGDWTYRRDARGSIAQFGQVGGTALMTLRCYAGQHLVLLSVEGVPGNARVTTTSMTRSIPLRAPEERSRYVAAAIVPSDGLLDAIAFSRGRFVIAPHGGPTLVLPPYAEVGRVIEDCRG